MHMKIKTFLQTMLIPNDPFTTVLVQAKEEAVEEKSSMSEATGGTVTPFEIVVVEMQVLLIVDVIGVVIGCTHLNKHE